MKPECPHPPLCVCVCLTCTCHISCYTCSVCLCLTCTCHISCYTLLCVCVSPVPVIYPATPCSVCVYHLHLSYIMLHLLSVCECLCVFLSHLSLCSSSLFMGAPLLLHPLVATAQPSRMTFRPFTSLLHSTPSPYIPPQSPQVPQILSSSCPLHSITYTPPQSPQVPQILSSCISTLLSSPYTPPQSPRFHRY